MSGWIHHQRSADATALLAASMYRLRAAIADALAVSRFSCSLVRRMSRFVVAESRAHAEKMEWRADEMRGCITAVRGTSLWIACRTDGPLPPDVTVKDVILWPGQLDFAFGDTPEQALDRLRLECLATREE